MRTGKFVFVFGLIILIVALFAIWAFFKSIEIDSDNEDDTIELSLPGKTFHKRIVEFFIGIFQKTLKLYSMSRRRHIPSSRARS